jgi:N-acetylglucosamine-6-phosphate deacetylase
MTQSPENISKAMTAVKDYMAEGHAEGAEVIGIHLEGPFISTKHIGAQPLEYVADPCVEVFKNYNELSGNAIRIVSMAPEVEGAGELVEYMASVGVVPSLGHTDATYNDIDTAIARGAKNVTHTFNAQKALHHREIGTVGTALLRDELNCELICDTIHVSLPAIRLVAQNKPLDKLTLVTDTMRAKHMPDGESELGGQLVS